MQRQGDRAIRVLDRAGDEQATRACAATAAGRGCAGRDGKSAGRDGKSDERRKAERNLNEFDSGKLGDFHRLSFPRRAANDLPLFSLTPIGVPLRPGSYVLPARTRTGRAAPTWPDKRMGRQPEPGFCCRPGDKRQAGRSTYEVIRGGRRPHVWSNAQRRGRRIPRCREDGKARRDRSGFAGR